MYPQELTITFANAKVVNEVKFQTTGARKVVIEGCQTSTVNAFKSIAESKGKYKLSIMSSELASRGGMQNESLKIAQPAPFVIVKFIITEGHEDFTSVHNITFN